MSETADTPNPPSEPMIAMPIGVVLRAYNHLTFATQQGAFNKLPIIDMKGVIDNMFLMRQLLPKEHVEVAESRS